MSIVKIIDDYVLEFGNQRFLEGWNGQKDYVIKLLEAHAETYLTTKEAIERDLSEDWHTGFTDAIAFIQGEK